MDLTTLERLPFVTRSEIGRSIENRPLYKLDIGSIPTPASCTDTST